MVGWHGSGMLRFKLVVKRRTRLLVRRKKEIVDQVEGDETANDRYPSLDQEEEALSEMSRTPS